MDVESRIERRKNSNGTPLRVWMFVQRMFTSTTAKRPLITDAGLEEHLNNPFGQVCMQQRSQNLARGRRLADEQSFATRAIPANRSDVHDSHISFIALHPAYHGVSRLDI